MTEHKYQAIGIDIDSAIRGRSAFVDTSYGPIHVLISGDTTLPACVTFHEVGVNARTCFNGFFSASEPKKSLLLKSFCFYHFDFPGCEVDVPQHERGGTSCTSSSRGGGSGNGGSEEEVLSLNDVSLQVGEAMKHLNIKQALGMGVGSGAYILTKTALAFPKAFAGLVLFAPCCKKATWWEYMFGKVLLKCLWYYGWNSKFAHTHLYQRLFSSATNAAAQDGYGVSELLYTFNQEVEKIDPRSIWKYLRAVLDREDILDDVKNLKSRVLLFLCVDSIYKHESLEMNLRLQHNIADYIEVFDSGTLITEQLPQETLGPIDQFVELLHQGGYCRRKGR